MPDPRLEPNQILQGDCREILRTLPSASIDSIVTDPPAGIAFMGKDWDNPDKFDTNFTEHGYSDGQDRIAAPTQRLSNRNPMCRKCRKHMRGAGGCECLEPESDEPASKGHMDAVELKASREANAARRAAIKDLLYSGK